MDSSTIPERRHHNPPRPSWCRHLLLRTRFTTLLVTLLLLLDSSTYAAPSQHEKYHRRQAIPDRYGNTGSRPAPIIPVIPVLPPPPAPRVSISTDPAPSPTLIPAFPTSVIIPIPTTSPSTPSAPSTLNSTPLLPSPFPSPSSPSPPANTSASIPPILPTPPTQLQLLAPPTKLSPAAITGITLGSIVFLLLLFTTYIALHRRSQLRRIHEIEIDAPIGSRTAGRVFGKHYDERIKRSRSKNVKKKEREKAMEMQSSVSSWGNISRKKEAKGGYWSTPEVVKTPVSPSVYSQYGLTHATRFSVMSFGSVGGWLEKNAVKTPQMAFMGMERQIEDVPRPLFAGKGQGSEEEVLVVGWKGDISPPRPVRPQSADPLGRLSGMGFGLGMR